MVCQQSDQSVIGSAKHFREFKKIFSVFFFFFETDYVEMSCTGRACLGCAGIEMLALT